MRALVVSDVHANLPALDAVLDDAGALGGWDEIWCLGDTVGYGAQPNECLERLRANPLRIILGNHDLAATGDISLTEFNDAAAASAAWTRAVLTDEHTAFLRALPMRETWGEFTLTHGSPREPIWEYVTSSFVATACFGFFDTRFCLVGHTHVPLYFVRDDEQRTLAFDLDPGTPLRLATDRMIINPGSVGQPRNGDPAASYALYDSEEGVFLRRSIPYPVAETQALIRAAGLPEFLAERLAMGW